MASVGIVIIGDEILSGKFADENGPFLIRELRSLGVELRQIATINDDAGVIGATVAEFSRRYDSVFTSGGIGPTHDDVTIAAIAAAFATPVVRPAELEAKLRAHWGDRLAPANLRLAEVPAGSELIYGSGGDDGVWPTVMFRNIVILPGVPALFRRKFLQVRERFRAVPVTVARLTFAADEGELAPLLDEIVARFPQVKVGSYPRFEEPGVHVLVTIEGRAALEVAAASAALEELAPTHLIRLDLEPSGG